MCLQVFNQSSVVQEDAGWRDNLYRMYTTSSANMRVAVYGSKHDAANYEALLRKFCAVSELVSERGLPTGRQGVLSTLRGCDMPCLASQSVWKGVGSDAACAELR